MNIPIELQLEIIEKLDIKSLFNTLKTNKHYSKLLESYYSFFSKLLIKKGINYKDPYNYIFLINNVRQNWFREDPYNPNSKYDLFKIIGLAANAEGKSLVKEYPMTIIADEIQGPNPPDISLNIKSMSVNREKIDDLDYPLQMLILKLKKKYSQDKSVYKKLNNAFLALMFGIYDFEENDNLQLFVSEKEDLINQNMHEEAEELEYSWELAYSPTKQATLRS